ncbi:hypothetical protein B0T13DRAFT_216899 [Neurospora crassa]|nr:hypothetical protein B0T13DRAFT_216899 [Neurospora crassa]
MNSKEHHSTPWRTAWSLGACPAGRSVRGQSDCILPTQPRATSVSISRVGTLPLGSLIGETDPDLRSPRAPPSATPWTLRLDSAFSVPSLSLDRQPSLLTTFTSNLQRPPLIFVVRGQLRICSFYESKDTGFGLCFQR